MINRSLVRLSMPTRSTTSNHCPRPTSCRALIKNVSAPCVTAVEKLATLACGRLCPVLSAKLYTATLKGLPAAGGGIASNSFFIIVPVTVGLVSVTPVLWIIAHPLIIDINREINNSFFILEYKLS